MHSALAFVPPNDVTRYFELLIDEIRNNFNDECDDRRAGKPCSFPLPPFPHFNAEQKSFFFKLFNFFIFAFQEHRKCVFKASGEAKMQTFPPVPIMVAPTISTYVKNNILAPTFLKTRSGP